MSDSFRTRLAAALARQIDGFEELLACDKLTAGASLETYRLLARVAGKKTHYALRRSPLENSAGDAVGGIDLKTEAQLLQIMGCAGIPEPEVLYVLQPPDQLGSGFVMQWLDGETLGARILRSEELAAVRPRLARECGEILARIHSVDWQSHQLDQVLPRFSPEQLVHESWDCYRELGVAEPMIDYAARWLLEHLPEESSLSVVHGDFRNGNLMVTPEGIKAVLDWEIAHLGDPIRDLGWLCVNSWRYGNAKLPVGGFGEVEDLLAAYNSVAEQPVTPEQLVYWQVFGSFWWAVACLRMAQSWRGGENSSVERPAIGRRSSEAQMDCVNLLIPGAFAQPAAAADRLKHYRLPVAEELLESVERFLQQDVAVDADPQRKFMARVAANSLATVRREIGLSADLLQAEAERLREILDCTGEVYELRAQLVQALRNGLPLESEGLAPHLRQSVAGQLAIDQPEYTALQMPEMR
ncbi:MAG: phosphotransferase [Gammaproteobacteria bacterium]|nr:phosphotransferase [Gammaproteobacteria bacterium]